MNHHSLDELEEALGHRFASRARLEQALTHSSFAREGGRAAFVGEAAAAPPPTTGDNEQLEFLGDAVLQLVASQELFRRFPLAGEGQLSKMRAHLVNARHLVQCAEKLRLGGYLRLGKGEEKTGGRRKTALLADAVEAILAALYLDGGLAVARDFVLAHILDPELERLASCREEVVLVADHKSLLQERLQAAGLAEPRYELVHQEGPPHRRTFTMRVRMSDPATGGERSAEASGVSKKEASQAAAAKALELLADCFHDR